MNPQLFGNLGQFDYSRLGQFEYGKMPSGDSPALVPPVGAYAYEPNPFQPYSFQQILNYISGMANRINPNIDKPSPKPFGLGGVKG